MQSIVPTFRPSSAYLASNRSAGPWIACLFLLVVFASGCGGPSESFRDNQGTTAALQSQFNHLNHAMDYIFSLERFQQKSLNESIVSNLNQWVGTRSPEEWSKDPLISTLPPPFQQHVQLKTLDRLQFRKSDADLIQETAWAKSLSQWLVAQDRLVEYRYLFADTLKNLTPEQRDTLRSSDHQLQTLVQYAHPKLPADQVSQLTEALQLFDWVVRNIQLDNLLKPPGTSRNARANQEAIRLVKPGPGYTMHPWQVIKFGHGDSWQRARVLILLLRQRGIDAVMLAIQENPDDAPRPWLPAARIGSELYLFDTVLGLPFPDSDQGGVVTLHQLQADPKLLRKLDLTPAESLDDDSRYRIERGDLQHVVALIDASPGYMTHRFKILQNGLTGQRRLSLFLAPEEIAKRVEAAGQLKSVQLWTLPIETIEFRRRVDLAIASRNELVAGPFFRKEGFYDTDVQLAIARHRQLLGRFEADELVEKGAKQLLLELRYEDDYIDLLASDPQLQARFGIDRDRRATAAQKETQIRFVQQQMRIVRAHAVYWLALAHYETGRPSLAANWLGRVSTSDGDQRWTTGTNYNLARSHEALLEYQQALELYRKDKSPQKNGNLLRARLLQRLAPPEKDAAEPEQEQGSF